MAWRHLCQRERIDSVTKIRPHREHASRRTGRWPSIPRDSKSFVRKPNSRVRELTVDQVKAKLDSGVKFHLVDVREESEWAKDHLPGAAALGKGIIERDIEQKIPQLDAPIVLYCGGGYRSALAADNLQKMGYTNVWSMDGGIRGWREKGRFRLPRSRKPPACELRLKATARPS